MSRTNHAGCSSLFFDLFSYLKARVFCRCSVHSVCWLVYFSSIGGDRRFSALRRCNQRHHCAIRGSNALCSHIRCYWLYNKEELVNTNTFQADSFGRQRVRVAFFQVDEVSEPLHPKRYYVLNLWNARRGMYARDARKLRKSTISALALVDRLVTKRRRHILHCIYSRTNSRGWSLTIIANSHESLYFYRNSITQVANYKVFQHMTSNWRTLRPPDPIS